MSVNPEESSAPEETPAPDPASNPAPERAVDAATAAGTPAAEAAHAGPALGNSAAEAAPADPADSPEERATVTEDAVRVQRSPRYFRFMLTGAILFAIIALILTFSFPENPTYDRAAVFGFLLAVCVTIGVALGAVAALLADRAVTRRARTVQADRIDVHVDEDESRD
jgi:uncharacterized membrane protein